MNIQQRLQIQVLHKWSVPQTLAAISCRSRDANHSIETNRKPSMFIAVSGRLLLAFQEEEHLRARLLYIAAVDAMDEEERKKIY